ncbi:oxidoreductase [Aquisalinus flavus]|uniref:Short-chain dehydrogenase n=1 Tax=Aquisalinus flavus TaxID=1526572 RepID=A0A8J2V322_9PROT|nr:oxidoreductase [Aquisalinus flavus]MBD0426162.1 SDR family NAD(P)-dependent oxidoreductase [Aquisalinus flavus]UNE48260.1 SDR family NAD(P)-dependent oxidoreductase [Aquisalinus flavus]GGD10091.1 short-chain dehydrogenase [Aquisalinus flavus]
MAPPRRQFTGKGPNGDDWGKYGWTPGCLPDQNGKVFVITGGNSGIGLETARMLGRRCATVVLLCRSLNRANEAIEDLRRTSPANCDYSAIECDLADLSSVASAAEKVRSEHDRIDALINNAGIMLVPARTLTRDGFEMHFGTNHLGHFALSPQLSALVEASGGRFVTVSSQAANGMKNFDFDDPHAENRYSSILAYAQSKLANLLFAVDLQRRLEIAGCKATSHACHPGIADTNIAVTGPSQLARFAMMPVMTLFAQTAARGAIPTVLAAAAAEAEPIGPARGYYGPTGFQSMGGRVDRAEIKRQALDEEAGRRLWAMSEAMTGVSWPIFTSAA